METQSVGKPSSSHVDFPGDSQYAQSSTVDTQTER